ncbi:hypothetical protein LRS03_02895 [Rhizobacter sp. J219]|uniref:hypothetical protein n=1 Tax=Rhizobacter sp. J219 TaxID=2898430 RepID=UPI0021510A7A|nr:hypothetical protein [Rhizobacter sp. J219]MCR5881860.1 hypothetical protein [Rhizobacter sp. J219]
MGKGGGVTGGASRAVTCGGCTTTGGAAGTGATATGEATRSGSGAERPSISHAAMPSNASDSTPTAHHSGCTERGVVSSPSSASATPGAICLLCRLGTAPRSRSESALRSASRM